MLIERDPWILRYLTDYGQELPVEEEKMRGWGSGPSRIGYAVVSPETYQMIVDHPDTNEPYIWDELLLDARDQLPNVGSATVMAFAALENFIGWALDILEHEKPLPSKLWTWIKERDDEHWLKTPTVAERFDTLLKLFTGRSLKDEPELWKGFTEIRKARNALAHQGIAMTGGKPVDSAKAKALVDAAEKIIAWVERLVPEAQRRTKLKRPDHSGGEWQHPRRPTHSVGLGSRVANSGRCGPAKVLPSVLNGTQRSRPNRISRKKRLPAAVVRAYEFDGKPLEVCRGLRKKDREEQRRTGGGPSRVGSIGSLMVAHGCREGMETRALVGNKIG